MADLLRWRLRCPDCDARITIYATEVDAWCHNKHLKPVRMEVTRKQLEKVEKKGA